MALDPLVVLCPPLQEYFVDKSSGEPLSGGVVTFFQDSDRTNLKPIYTLNQIGSYSDASYVQLPNPLILSSVGTFVDNNGNDIIPYLFPYDGVPGDTKQTLDLYYITVYNSAGVLQFTRAAWPNTASGSSTNVNTQLNYIPNGQFLLHNNFPVTITNALAVPSSASVIEIAQGGWTFQVPSGTSSVNPITFVRQNSADTNPDASADPRYVIDIQCTTISSVDTFKDLCITFPDVNKFASASGGTYTLSFQGESLSGFDLVVGIRLLKYFGAGGNTSTDVPFGNGGITINTQNSIYNISGTFGTNSGLNIGAGDDDYLQLAIRLPNVLSHIQLTDFILTNGTVTVTGFPQTPNADMLNQSTAGWLPTPNPNGFDLYLPLVLTPSGLTYSSADIGKINAAMYETLPIGELDCNGTQYLSSGYSSDGIPYARLQSVWYDSTDYVNYFGNGANYMTANFTGVSPGAGSLRLNISSPGLGTIADVNTLFTFANICNGTTTGCVGYTEGGITVIDNVVGAQTPPSAGTSGFTITDIRNTSNSYHIFSISPQLPVTGGTYFTFHTSSGSFYMWFTVDTVGGDPAPGGTGIKVNLLSTYSVNEVARCIKEAISGYQTEHIFPVSGSSIVQSSYFAITTPSSAVFVVWYNLNGAGTDPNPGFPAQNKIQVNVVTADSAISITTKTVDAINRKYFAVPDLRGLYLRGWDAGAGVDLDIASRYTQNNFFENNSLGSFQIDDFFSHLHANTASSVSTVVPFSGNTAIVQNNAGTSGGTLATPTGGGIDLNHTITVTTATTMTNAITGGNETTPQNVYVRWTVKY